MESRQARPQGRSAPVPARASTGPATHAEGEFIRLGLVSVW